MDIEAAGYEFLIVKFARKLPTTLCVKIASFVKQVQCHNDFHLNLRANTNPKHYHYLTMKRTIGN